MNEQNEQRYDADAHYAHGDVVKYRNADAAVVESLRRRHAEASDYLVRLDVRPAAESGAMMAIVADRESGPTGNADALALVRHTLEQLEIHLDDPDGSSLSSQGMLEVTRDRISTLYALMVDAIPAPTDPRFTPECPRCSVCSEPIVWSESRGGWAHRDRVAVWHAVETPESASTSEPAPFDPDPELYTPSPAPPSGPYACGVFVEWSDSPGGRGCALPAGHEGEHDTLPVDNVWLPAAPAPFDPDPELYTPSPAETSGLRHEMYDPEWEPADPNRDWAGD